MLLRVCVARAKERTTRVARARLGGLADNCYKLAHTFAVGAHITQCVTLGTSVRSLEVEAGREKEVRRKLQRTHPLLVTLGQLSHGRDHLQRIG